MGSLFSSEISNEDIEAYHILQVQKNSPAQIAGLENFFDFIVAISNVELNGSHEVLLLLLRQNVGKPINLKIYSNRTNQYRYVNIIPNANWGGNGLLGLTIRYCLVRDALKDVHHILEVHSGSPAESAGLKPYTDYIIGTYLSKTENDINFLTLIEDYEEEPLKIFVYSILDCSCRTTYIIPNSKWGGKGLLGCDIGNGYLHQIPKENDIQYFSSLVKNTINFVVETVENYGNDQKNNLTMDLEQSDVYNTYPYVNEDSEKNVIDVQPSANDINSSYNKNEKFESYETKIMIEGIDDIKKSDNILLPCDVL